MGPGVSRKQNRKDRVAKKCEEEFGKRSWNRFGHPRATFLRLGGSWVVTLGTPGLTFGTPRVTLGTPGEHFGHPGGPYGPSGGSFLNPGGRQSGFHQ